MHLHSRAVSRFGAFALLDRLEHEARRGLGRAHLSRRGGERGQALRLGGVDEPIHTGLQKGVEVLPDGLDALARIARDLVHQRVRDRADDRPHLVFLHELLQVAELPERPASRRVRRAGRTPSSRVVWSGEAHSVWNAGMRDHFPSSPAVAHTDLRCNVEAKAVKHFFLCGGQLRWLYIGRANHG